MSSDNIRFWFTELFLSYKYAEKTRFEKAFNYLKPYLDSRLIMLIQDIYDQSYWLNPFTLKQGR